MSAPRSHLDPEKIVQTVELLSRRIRERFPRAGLANVCDQLVEIARQSCRTAESIARPMYSIRAFSALLIAAILVSAIWTVMGIQIPDQPMTATEFIQVLEASINAVVLIGATVLFLVSVETRFKRARALKAVHELRSLAHVIDMHQLTKDPDRILRRAGTGESNTASSPRTELTRFELNRYLDYCSEMLALTGKVASLYVEHFADAAAVQAANDIESLTTALARKVWQKIMVLHGRGLGNDGNGATPDSEPEPELKAQVGRPSAQGNEPSPSR